MFSQAMVLGFTTPQWVGAALIGLLVVRLVSLTVARNRLMFSHAAFACRPVERAERPGYFAVALLLTVVVIYGSLVPLDYHSMGTAEALERFAQTPLLNLDVGHRADWVANILLFMPVSFFWTAAISGSTSRVGRQLTCAALVVVGCFALAIGLEFVQIWFPPRTVSQNDVIAESIGTLIGTSLYLAVGPRLLRWFHRWTREQRPAAYVDGCLQAYTAMVLAYSLMPLDVVTSWDELARKFADGRITVASTAYTSSLTGALGHAAMDLLKFLPIGLIVTRRLRRRGCGLPACLLTGWALVASVELMQVFIYGRSAELVQVVTGGLGVTAGSLLSLHWRPEAPLERIVLNRKGRGYAGWLLACIVYAVALYRLNVNPSDGVVEGLTLRDSWDFYLQVPFARLYWGSEFHALTQILIKMTLFVPLGAMSLVASRRVSWRVWVRRAALAAATLACAVLTVLIELMQGKTHGHYGDVTDSLLNLAGFWIGVMLLHRFIRSVERQSMSRRSHDCFIVG